MNSGPQQTASWNLHLPVTGRCRFNLLFVLKPKCLEFTCRRAAHGVGEKMCRSEGPRLGSGAPVQCSVDEALPFVFRALLAGERKPGRLTPHLTPIILYELNGVPVRNLHGVSLFTSICACSPFGTSSKQYENSTTHF